VNSKQINKFLIHKETDNDVIITIAASDQSQASKDGNVQNRLEQSLL